MSSGTLAMPAVSLPMAAATAAIVVGIFRVTSPSVAETRVTQPGSPALDSSRKTATWISAAVVAGISLLAGDRRIFLVGGAMVVALDMTHRHANTVSPQTNKMPPRWDGARAA